MDPVLITIDGVESSLHDRMDGHISKKTIKNITFVSNRRTSALRIFLLRRRRGVFWLLIRIFEKSFRVAPPSKRRHSSNLLLTKTSVGSRLIAANSNCSWRNNKFCYRPFNCIVARTESTKQRPEPFYSLFRASIFLPLSWSRFWQGKSGSRCSGNRNEVCCVSIE
jgi:hypothetical protein